MVSVPYKSVAAALVLAVILGPIGVFYSSFIGGVVMSIFGLVALGTMASMHSPLPMATVCLLGIIWAMISVRFYNHKMLKVALSGNLSESMRFRKRKKSILKKEAKSVDLPEEVAEAEEAPASWKL
ncbi:MAG: hypothetical protein V4496_01170 [Pseudomonadota bacterium]